VTEDRMKSIDEKLSKIIMLLALNAVKGKSIAEAIESLNSLGLNSVEIGSILNKDPRNVRSYISQKRKKKR